MDLQLTQNALHMHHIKSMTTSGVESADFQPPSQRLKSEPFLDQDMLHGSGWLSEGNTEIGKYCVACHCNNMNLAISLFLNLIQQERSRHNAILQGTCRKVSLFELSVWMIGSSGKGFPVQHVTCH